MDGVATTNLQTSNFVDDVIGNYQGTTRRISIERLVAMLLVLTGPAYATRGELDADLDWPAGTIGRVYAAANSENNGVYKKTGPVGSGGWTRIGDLPGGAVESALIDELRNEVRSGRVYSMPGGDTPSGLDIPADRGITLLILRNNAANTESDWRPVQAPDPADETDDLKRDASGQWWRRMQDSDVVKLKGGAIYGRTGSIDPSGENIAPYYVLSVFVHNASKTFRFWTAANVAAPGDGLETDNKKRDAGGRWWQLLEDGAHTAIYQAIADAVAGGTEAVADEAAARADADAAHVAEYHTVWAGDPAVLARDINDNTALYTLPDGMTRGVFSLEDQRETDVYKLFTVSDQERLNAAAPVIWTGDDAVMVKDRNGNSALHVDKDGGTHANLVLDDFGWTGDIPHHVVVDKDRNVLFGFDRHGAPIFPGLFTIPIWTGDDLYRVFCDIDGKTIWGIHKDTGEWIGPGTSGGGTVDPDDPTDGSPDTPGNVWMARKTEHGWRYMSDQWAERTIGYEQRGNVTLAQTGSVAVGVVAFGGGDVAVQRVLDDHYDYHMRGADLDVIQQEGAAEAAGAELLNAAKKMPTAIAVSVAQPSITESEALAGSALRTALADDVQAAVTALAGWSKTLHIDRIKLSLLEGKNVSQSGADFHYAAVAQDLRDELGALTGQGAYPLTVVSPKGGGRTGRFETVSLAEARLDINHPTLGFVVATPLWPFELDPEGEVPSAASALMISEIEAIAVAERQSGRDWYCPLLVEAKLAGNVVTARFAAMSDLTLHDPAVHGLTFGTSITNGAVIQSVTVSGKEAIITFDIAPEGSLELRHAWAVAGTSTDDKPRNRGSISDQWSQVSRHDPAFTHRRWALPARVNVN
ncbi:hypothetical protein [Paracoccus onubensis]|uniref:Uncharacterized protein n=1 Tax=Paracoccus onubensis TaxID=1675788 RepID=A0A418T1R5_9RHOB|nr:hypothetical protein [Paracoccus onubensis]RJE87142.1 hypothetical protein D3P04_05175 [Paracoccus onubensis]